MKIKWIIVILFCLGFISCEKNQYDGYEIPKNKYEGPYEQKETIDNISFSTVEKLGVCELNIRYELDTAGITVHPDNIAFLIISSDDKIIQRQNIRSNFAILPHYCDKPRTFVFYLEDKEGYKIGLETTVVR